MNQLFSFLMTVLPPGSDRLLAAIGAAIGTALTVLLGGVSNAFLWLVGFMVSDYITGFAAAIKRRRFSYRVATKGICRKFLIVAICILAHGLDEMAGLEGIIQNAAIFAYGISEFWSILQNLSRLGYQTALPPQLEQTLAMARPKTSPIIVTSPPGQQTTARGEVQAVPDNPDASETAGGIRSGEHGNRETQHHASAPASICPPFLPSKKGTKNGKN